MKLYFSILIFSFAVFLGQAVCLFIPTMVPAKKNQLGQYFVYHTFTESKPTPQQINITYDNERSCTVEVNIYQLKDFIRQYHELVEISKWNSIFLQIPSEVQVIGNQLLIAIQSKYNSDLTITYGNKNNCIEQFLMIQQSCPNCRSQVSPNQLIDLILPNKLQA